MGSMGRVVCEVGNGVYGVRMGCAWGLLCMGCMTGRARGVGHVRCAMGSIGCAWGLLCRGCMTGRAWGLWGAHGVHGVHDGVCTGCRAHEVCNGVRMGCAAQWGA